MIGSRQRRCNSKKRTCRQPKSSSMKKEQSPDSIRLLQVKLSSLTCLWRKPDICLAVVFPSRYWHGSESPAHIRARDSETDCWHKPSPTATKQAERLLLSPSSLTA